MMACFIHSKEHKLTLIGDSSGQLEEVGEGLTGSSLKVK